MSVPGLRGPSLGPSGAQEPAASPGGAGPGHAPARPAGGSSERPRPPAAAREPASWVATSPVSRCSPCHSGPQAGTGTHELDAGARAGPAGSRRWPRGGSRGGSRLAEAGRGHAAPPCLPEVHTPFGRRAAGLDSPGCARAALPAPLPPGTRGPGAAGPACRRPLLRAALTCACRPAHSPSRPVATAQTGGRQQRGRALAGRQPALDCVFTPQVMSEVEISEDLKSRRVLRPA